MTGKFTKLTTTILGSFILGLSALAVAADTYSVDPVHSFVTFRIVHVGVSATHGRFDDVSGTFVVDDADPTKSTVDVQVKAESIDTNNKKRDEDLKGPDYFNVKQFPTIAFKSKSVKPAGDKKFEVSGDLTLHGVTKPLTFTLTHIGSGKTPFKDFRSGYETTFTIKRTDFDMKKMLEGIGDEVQITVAIEGIRQDAKK
ncbi:MAG: YceI family protein [Planctomycetes bacterium]|nr:YceI family protein [Planctomycetota bacterium]MBI3844863.1 YceI family protein [Planctomycetota bacterium]